MCASLGGNYFFKDFIYLFLEKGREGERGRETSMCVCLLRTHSWGPGLLPRHVPWLEIEQATLWFTVWCSIHWATPDGAGDHYSVYHNLKSKNIEIVTPQYVPSAKVKFYLLPIAWTAWNLHITIPRHLRDKKAKLYFWQTLEICFY